MSHPFDLDISKLEIMQIDFEEQLTNEEAAKVGGGILPGGCVTTKALGEEGGDIKPPIRFPDRKPPKNRPGKEPPVYTTLALGEEGGEPYVGL